MRRLITWHASARTTQRTELIVTALPGSGVQPLDTLPET